MNGIFKEMYVSPKMELLHMNVETIICQSVASPEKNGALMDNEFGW